MKIFLYRKSVWCELLKRPVRTAGKWTPCYAILKEVSSRGDAALFEYQKFDKADLESWSHVEFNEADVYWIDAKSHGYCLQEY
jgi:histidinol dehydrogenase